LIATPDSRVWAIADGTKRWITSGDTFLAMGYEFADIVGATTQVAAVHPEGPVISL